ncbi:SDR family oxidoreductase [Aliirhizobium terrae]|uniref:SDR family oxidoreductase n=1 Tax=Terrirhizobium terrae TaxID=2926709 RepID=UPI002576A7D4|nr:SDR family oxidoreductase [Rhizobium sp. CC-CFT758]WJH40807.1 SDR family oxidoreductase [Rhizobium sp. CC-CFT758]
MRVFVTGATGFVGSAVVRELIDAGHQVTGLARSENSAAALVAAGATAHHGHLEDLDSLRRGADAADATIHCGFIHDFSRFKENCELDRRVVDALGSTLAGSNRLLVVTSGTGLITPGRIATEDDLPTPGRNPRIASEEAAAAAAAKGARVSIIRLPPSVHGEGDHGFVPILIDLARRTGVSAYVGNGENRWPAVHRRDAARLYRAVVESGITEPRYHAVAEEGIMFREIAEVIGSQLGVPVVSKSHEEAAEHFEWFAHFAQLDGPASSEHTKRLTSWQPHETDLLDDLRQPYYVAA